MTGRYFQDGASKTVIGCGCTYSLQRGIVASRKKAATGQRNLFALSSRMNYGYITMAARKARRKGTLARGDASYAEVVHHPSARVGDVKQDTSCLSQFPRFFAISGRQFPPREIP